MIWISLLSDVTPVHHGRWTQTATFRRMGDQNEASKERVESGCLEKLICFRNAVIRELGVEPGDISCFENFTRLLHYPRDPSGLAVIRILYGLLMVVDVHHERGLSQADRRWGDPSECRFPFLHFLAPLPLKWMIILYCVMLAGAVGIALGYRYRLSCICFLLPYWYIFLLDKSHWNNHSYLFGLIGTQLMLTGANQFWSLDSIRLPEIKNRHVPLWNYAVLRGQIFLVYFIAGLKKTNLDWLGGYSMEKLGHHWVFDAFRLVLSGDQITYFVVHLGGFLLDLTVGFFMIMRFSRPYAFFFCGLFNFMNSRMFAIGMFPYVMIAVMPIFCSADWPKKVVNFLALKNSVPSTSDALQSTDCIYEEHVKQIFPSNNDSPKTSETQSANSGSISVKFRHQMAASAFILYFCLQGFLPYSHSLTKGYNTWTQGLYGYSWDMMVHNWRYVHTTITAVDKETGRFIHLDPEAWTRSHRWTHHADMVKQFAHCVQEKMSREYGLNRIALYVDAWISLNRRFTQRMYDPSVDILSVKWSPFEEVTWVLPLQNDLLDWRENLVAAEERILAQSENVDVIFVTDFPGFHLLNYVGESYENITLTVMKGSVEIDFEHEGTVQLKKGQNLQIPSGTYHRVSPLKHRPACYMYVYYSNKTGITSYRTELNGFLPSDTCPSNGLSHRIPPDQKLTNCTGYFCWERIKLDLIKKFSIWTRSMLLIGRALCSILTCSPMIISEKETVENVSS